MGDAEITGAFVLILLLLYALGGVYHEHFFPKATQDKARHIAEYFAQRRGAALNPAIPLPIIMVKTSHEIIDMLAPEEKIKYFGWEMYAVSFKKMNRIVLSASHCHIDTLAHEIAHWFEEDDCGENEKCDKAWRFTRIYLQSFYPSQYYILTTTYFWLGLWLYMFLEDPIFEI